MSVFEIQARASDDLASKIFDLVDHETAENAVAVLGIVKALASKGLEPAASAQQMGAACELLVALVKGFLVVETLRKSRGQSELSKNADS